MTAYLIVRANVTDPEQYKKYAAVSPGVVEKYEGKYIARGGETVTLEGPEENRRVVIIEFPSLEKAQAFYHSPEYREARKLRAGAAVGEFIAVDGLK